MAFVVIYDACVLYPAPLRDLLMRLAEAEAVRARWTDAILNECFENILAKRSDLDPKKLQRTRELMCRAVPDCLIMGYEGLIESLDLPDPNDRHVLAAAIRAGAQAIVTFSLADFPADKLAAYNVEAKHPDDFVIETIDLAPATVIKVITEQIAGLKAPPMTVLDLLDELRTQRLVQSVARLRELFGASGV
jgi:predicted nucleic acid-binding protein